MKKEKEALLHSSGFQWRRSNSRNIFRHIKFAASTPSPSSIPTQTSNAYIQSLNGSSSDAEFLKFSKLRLCDTLETEIIIRALSVLVKVRFPRSDAVIYVLCVLVGVFS